MQTLLELLPIKSCPCALPNLPTPPLSLPTSVTHTCYVRKVAPTQRPRHHITKSTLKMSSEMPADQFRIALVVKHSLTSLTCPFILKKCKMTGVHPRSRECTRGGAGLLQSKQPGLTTFPGENDHNLRETKPAASHCRPFSSPPLCLSKPAHRRMVTVGSEVSLLFG